MRMQIRCDVNSPKHSQRTYETKNKIDEQSRWREKRSTNRAQFKTKVVIDTPQRIFSCLALAHTLPYRMRCMVTLFCRVLFVTAFRRSKNVNEIETICDLRAMIASTHTKRTHMSANCIRRISFPSKINHTIIE